MLELLVASSGMRFRMRVGDKDVALVVDEVVLLVVIFVFV